MTEKLSNIVSKLKNKITQRGDLPHVTVHQQLNYIDQLTQFSLGQSLLETKCFNALWTDQILFHSETSPSFLEDFILNHSIFTKAWKEVLQIFQKLTQERLENEIILASIPSGAMRDVLELDYSHLSNFTLIGVDIDENCLNLARDIGDKEGLLEHLKLLNDDAWALPYLNEIDLITSCGLNIYISDRKKLLDLYRQFYKALKSKGTLIMSFLTHPPRKDLQSEWNIDIIPPKTILLEKVLYEDILEVEWHNFTTTEGLIKDLEAIGFERIEIHYDSMRAFPVAIARKP